MAIYGLITSFAAIADSMSPGKKLHLPWL